MAEINVFLVLLAVGAAIFAFVQWNRANTLGQAKKSAEDAAQLTKSEADSLRKDTATKREELDTLRGTLQDTQSKLKRVKSQVDEKVERAKSEANTPESQFGAVVRVTDQEVEERHAKAIEALKTSIAALDTELAALRVKDAKNTEEAAERARKLAAAASAPPGATIDHEAQLEAFKRASVEREEDLKKEIRKLKAAARSHERRASSNYQLYQVAKGQLAVIEERMARLRQKYEGAKTPSELKSELPTRRPVTAAPEAPAPEPVASEPAEETASAEVETQRPEASEDNEEQVPSLAADSHAGESKAV